MFLDLNMTLMRGGGWGTVDIEASRLGISICSKQKAAGNSPVRTHVAITGIDLNRYLLDTLLPAAPRRTSRQGRRLEGIESGDWLISN